MAGAIAPAPALRRPLDSRGPKPPASARPAPGQRPTRPRRALRSRRVGRWPLSLPDLPVHRAPSRAGGETRVAFPAPPVDGPEGLATIRLPPLPWQRPSPLPQRYAVSTPAGGQSPRPAPDPPTAGASPLPGRALACRCSRTCRSTGHRRARAGETRVAFPGSARSGVPAHFGMPGLSDRGHRPCHSAALILGPPGAKAPGQRPTRPRRALRTRRVGRWPFVVPEPAGLLGTVPRGRGNAGRVSGSRPMGQSPSPDREESPGRQAVGLLFQHPVRAAKVTTRGRTPDLQR